MTHKKQILKSASTISLLTIFSRILGYVRDQRITLLLGTSPLADAFVIAYRIPGLFRRLVGEGSLTASFIPVFSRYLATEPRRAVWEFADRLFWTLAAVLATVATLGIVFSSQMIRGFTLIAPNRDLFDHAVNLNRIMFPYIFFIGLAALSMAILNCFHIFGTPAAAPVLLNVAIITCSTAVVWRHFSNPAIALAIGVLIGGALQFLIQVPQLVAKGMHFDLGFSVSHPGVRSVAALMGPGFFGIGVAQINFLVSTMFATSSRMPQGSVTALYVAERVMELVLGVYAIAVATAILPMMSHQAAAGDFESLKDTFAFSMRIVSFITIPAAVGLVVLRGPIIQVLFEHGQFVASSTRLTSQALFYYAFGLPAFAAIKLIVPAFYSTHDTRLPVLVAAYTLALNIVLNVLCLRWLYPVFRNGGPAFATVVAAYFNFFTLFALFRVRFGRVGTAPILASVARVAVCAAAMGVLCWLALRWSNFDSYRGFLPRLGIVAALLSGATAVYFGLAWVFRCHEISEVYGIAFHSEHEPETAGLLP